MNISRRDLLRSSAIAMAGLATSPQWLRVGGHAQAAEPESVLVTLFLRGAADGLSLAVPHGDPDYYTLRPHIQVPPGTEVDLDGFYGLHPHLAPLLPIYSSGHMAISHAFGSPHPSRSHFEAQDFMERAAPGRNDIQDGWLNRTLSGLGGAQTYTGISVGGALPPSLHGSEDVISMGGLDTFTLTQDREGTRRAAIEQIYAQVPDTLLGDQLAHTFDAVDGLQNLPAPTIDYPATKLGARLRDASRIIRGRVGTRILSLDLDGWDHHSGAVAGMDKMAPELAQALAAFWTDLGTDQQRVICLVMTEFGRTAAENGSLGSDHGHGSAMFALGGPIQGGQVITSNGGWPGLGPAQLYQGRDLAVTTDFRDVFAEIADKHLGLQDLTPLFPDFAADPAHYPGLLA
ncbi:MAG: DUF1501 domain-containing protein [Myxococcota bacterium]|nr:DUF1501 domain-containing protein [Myxococcota bacterium]